MNQTSSKIHGKELSGHGEVFTGIYTQQRPHGSYSHGKEGLPSVFCSELTKPFTVCRLPSRQNKV
jgi:hypothetical protein